MVLPNTDHIPMPEAGQAEGGDRIAPFILPNQDGVAASPMDDKLAGKPLLLVFECADGDTGDGGETDGAFARELAALRELGPALANHETIILAITRRSIAQNHSLHAACAASFPVLSDPAGKVYAAYGLAPKPTGSPTVTLVMDHNFRVMRKFAGGDVGSHAARALEALKEAAGDLPVGRIGGHAPVLVLPRVLSREDCARIAQVWQRPVKVWDTDGMVSEGFAAEKGDFKVRNESYGRVVQMVVRDPQVLKYVDGKLARRVLPEIRKAFQTSPSQREDIRIACYDAADGGVLPAHRDNPGKAVRHRRFTLSVTLNAEEFTGGALRFAEYGRQDYLVPTGTAIVWSCALLHEVLPITSGRRLILGTHLFGA